MTIKMGKGFWRNSWHRADVNTETGGIEVLDASVRFAPPNWSGPFVALPPGGYIPLDNGLPQDLEEQS